MFAVAPLGLVLLASAYGHPQKNVDGSGKLATEIRAVGSFHAVSSEVPFPVEITMGGPEQVALTCDDNLMSLLVTRIDGGRLVIEVDRDRDIHPDAGCVAKVSATSLDGVALAGSGRISVKGEAALDSLSISGSGDIDVERLATHRLSVSIAGSGTIVASGQTDDVTIDVSGSGDVRLAGVAANDAHVSISGSGDVELSARHEVVASITGSGDVEIHGEAKVQQSVVGSGTVRVIPTDAI
jgi:hypothetical protein